VLAVPTAHRFACRKEVTLGELAKEALWTAKGLRELLSVRRSLAEQGLRLAPLSGCDGAEHQPGDRSPRGERLPAWAGSRRSHWLAAERAGDSGAGTGASNSSTTHDGDGEHATFSPVATRFVAWVRETVIRCSYRSAAKHAAT